MSVASAIVAFVTSEHPWRRLRRRPNIDLSWRRMPGRLGETNGSNVIVMNPDQLQVERRCTLAHELAHIELGHVGGCTGREEADATRMAARWLVDMGDLLAALRWADDLPTVADELWVDEATLMARLDGLTADERAQIVALHAKVERGC